MDSPVTFNFLSGLSSHYLNSEAATFMSEAKCTKVRKVGGDLKALSDVLCSYDLRQLFRQVRQWVSWVCVVYFAGP